MSKMNNILKSKTFKYGSMSMVLVAVAVAIAVLLNVVVGMIDSKLVSLKFDLTANKIYSIGDTTKDILTKLNKDVTIYGLFDDSKLGTEYKEVKELLNHYKKYPHIKVEYIDPDKNPGVISKFDPEGLKGIQRNDFFVISGNKSKKLSYYDLFKSEVDQQSFQQYITGSNAEQSITGAIKYVTSEKTPAVYFTEGHDEGKVDSQYKTVKGQLEKNNYDVKTVNLFTAPKVPEDAEILIVASPRKDLAADEANKIKDYLKNGGKAVFLFDSLESTVAFNQFDDVLKNYNVSLNYDKVKEGEGRHIPNNESALVLKINSNSVIKDEFDMILANSRSLNILKNQKEYMTVTPLMKTSNKSVGVQIDKSKGKDIQGPLVLSVAVEDKGGAKATKVLVIGNGFFVSDSAMEQYGPYFNNGMHFFVSALNWMQDKQDDVVIGAKQYDAQKLTITEGSANVIGLVVVIVVPLLILGSGMFVWMRRRHL